MYLASTIPPRRSVSCDAWLPPEALLQLPPAASRRPGSGQFCGAIHQDSLCLQSSSYFSECAGHGGGAVRALLELSNDIHRCGHPCDSKHSWRTLGSVSKTSTGSRPPGPSRCCRSSSSISSICSLIFSFARARIRSLKASSSSLKAFLYSGSAT